MQSPYAEPLSLLMAGDVADVGLPDDCGPVAHTCTSAVSLGYHGYIKQTTRPAHGAGPANALGHGRESRKIINNENNIIIIIIIVPQENNIKMMALRRLYFIRGEFDSRAPKSRGVETDGGGGGGGGGPANGDNDLLTTVCYTGTLRGVHGPPLWLDGERQTAVGVAVTGRGSWSTYSAAASAASSSAG